MIIIATPKRVIFLPSPGWGDTTRLNNTMQLKRSMDGSICVTHVKTIERKHLKYDFELTRLKSLELLEFYKNCATELCTLTNGDVYSGYLAIDELEVAKIKRGVIGNSVEVTTVALEFEVV